MVAELLTFAATAAERTSMTDARKQTWCDGIGKNIEEDQMVLLVSRINDENGGTEGEQPAREDEHGSRRSRSRLWMRLTMCFRKAGSKKLAKATSGTRRTSDEGERSRKQGRSLERGRSWR